MKLLRRKHPNTLASTLELYNEPRPHQTEFWFRRVKLSADQSGSASHQGIYVGYERMYCGSTRDRSDLSSKLVQRTGGGGPLWNAETYPARKTNQLSTPRH